MKSNELRQFVEKIKNQVGGWCSVEKAMAMGTLIIEEQIELSVEIGVFYGSSLLPMAKAHSLSGKGIVIGIDPYDQAEATCHLSSKDHCDWWAGIELAEVMKDCWGVHGFVCSNGLFDQAVLLQTTSEKALVWFGSTPTIGMLHVDGNHSEECSLFDVQHYVPLVKAGGYVWFDDADWKDAGKNTTGKAVEYLRDVCGEELGRVGTDCLLFKKK